MLRDSNVRFGSLIKGTSTGVVTCYEKLPTGLVPSDAHVGDGQNFMAELLVPHDPKNISWPSSSSSQIPCDADHFGTPKLRRSQAGSYWPVIYELKEALYPVRRTSDQRFRDQKPLSTAGPLSELPAEPVKHWLDNTISPSIGPESSLSGGFTSSGTPATSAQSNDVRVGGIRPSVELRYKGSRHPPNVDMSLDGSLRDSMATSLKLPDPAIAIELPDTSVPSPPPLISRSPNIPPGHTAQAVPISPPIRPVRPVQLSPRVLTPPRSGELPAQAGASPRSRQGFSSMEPTAYNQPQELSAQDLASPVVADALPSPPLQSPTEMSPSGPHPIERVGSASSDSNKLQRQSTFGRVGKVFSHPFRRTSGSTGKIFAATLFTYVRENDNEEVKALLAANVDVNVRSNDDEGNTALHYAARAGHASMISTLIEKGAKIGAKSSGTKRTPLHEAALQGHTTAVLALPAADADKNAIARDNSTPLHLAAGRGHIETVKALVKANANISATRSDGRSALELSITNKHSAVSRYLQKAAERDVGVLHPGLA